MESLSRLRVGITLAGVLLAAACAGGARAPDPPPGPQPLDETLAAAQIRAASRFAERIRVEVSSVARGPTVDALAAAGLIEVGTDQSPFTLTAAGRAAGFETIEFQSDIPVYRVPVAERRLLGVVRIDSPPENWRDAVATFRYESVPSDLGQALLRGGARPDTLADTGPRQGRAHLTVTQNGWRVVSIEL